LRDGAGHHRQIGVRQRFIGDVGRIEQQRRGREIDLEGDFRAGETTHAIADHGEEQEGEEGGAEQHGGHAGGLEAALGGIAPGDPLAHGVRLPVGGEAFGAHYS